MLRISPLFTTLFCSLWAILLGISFSLSAEAPQPLFAEKELHQLNVFTLTPLSRPALPAEQASALSAYDLALKIYERAFPLHSTLKLTTPEKEARYVHATAGIPEGYKGTIFLHSRGFARREKPEPGGATFASYGGGVVGACSFIRSGIINAPCITFDPPDNRFSSDYAVDTIPLAGLYHTIVTQNPDAQIILIGDCAGAFRLLRFASHHSDQIEGLVLLSPFVSLKDMAGDATDYYLGGFPGTAQLTHSIFSWWFNDHRCKHAVARNVKEIPNIPIIIGHRLNDNLISNRHITQFVQQLRDTGHTKVTLIAVEGDDGQVHSRLHSLPAFRRKLNACLQKYGLPYNPELASFTKL